MDCGAGRFSAPFPVCGPRDGTRSVCMASTEHSLAQAKLERSEQINGWLFIVPALVLLGIFMIYPIVWSLWMSFQTGRGMNFTFGGFANIAAPDAGPGLPARARQHRHLPGRAGADHADAGAALCGRRSTTPSSGAAASSARRSSCPAPPRLSPTRSSSSRCSPMTASSTTSCALPGSSPIRSRGWPIPSGPRS